MADDLRDKMLEVPVDKAFRQGIGAMGTRGPQVTPGEWLEAFARLMGAALPLRGGVGMPGGFGPSFKKMLSSSSDFGVVNERPIDPSALLPYSDLEQILGSSASTARTLTSQSLRGDSLGPLGRFRSYTDLYGQSGARLEREDLVNRLLEALFQSSRQ